LSFTPQVDILRSLSPHFPSIAYAAGLSGYAGLTVPLSLFLDIFGALTLHISLSHTILRKALSYQTYALRSLWNLFRGEVENRKLSCELIRLTGKRFNVLHRRTDSWHYEVDQLILGTLLFTLFTFILPTLLTYALLFTLVRKIQFGVGVNARSDLVTRAVDEVRSCHHLQHLEPRGQSDEPFPTVRSSAENQGSEEITRLASRNLISTPLADDDSWTGSVYFRVISDNGSPMLMLEVRFDTFMAKGNNQTRYRYKLCPC
jgi:N-acetylglucosaminyl transferase component (Gpi1)